MNETTLDAFFAELDNIEKEAGWLKNSIVGLGMLGAVGGGMKAMAPSAARAATRMAKPAATAVAKKAPRVGIMGGGQARTPEVGKALGFLR